MKDSLTRRAAARVGASNAGTAFGLARTRLTWPRVLEPSFLSKVPQPAQQSAENPVKGFRLKRTEPMHRPGGGKGRDALHQKGAGL